MHVDPVGLLSSSEKAVFISLLKEFQLVFNSHIPGYNGAAGLIEGVVNMGLVEPLQCKGHVPRYSHDQLDQLQTNFDDLETQGVFHRPGDLKVVVEYLNPSFQVKSEVKRNNGFCLVTAFTDVGRYGKHQPSLMLDVDSTLLKIACWKYNIVSDLSQAFYQIPLSKNSMEYCGMVVKHLSKEFVSTCAMPWESPRGANMPHPG